MVKNGKFDKPFEEARWFARYPHLHYPKMKHVIHDASYSIVHRYLLLNYSNYFANFEILMIFSMAISPLDKT